jgi:hypothetical protein
VVICAGRRGQCRVVAGTFSQCGGCRSLLLYVVERYGMDEDLMTRGQVAYLFRVTSAAVGSVGAAQTAAGGPKLGRKAWVPARGCGGADVERFQAQVTVTGTR